jgi:hypothetical protein
MGEVIKFPQGRRSRKAPAKNAAATAVIILPVIRIERGPDAPVQVKTTKSAGKSTSSRKRRTRAAAVPPSPLPSPACG